MTTPVQDRKPGERGTFMEIPFLFVNADTVRSEARRVAPGKVAHVTVNDSPSRIARSASEPDVVSVAYVENTNRRDGMLCDLDALTACVDFTTAYRVESGMAGDAFTTWHAAMLDDLPYVQRNMPPWETEDAWRARMDNMWLRASSQMHVDRPQDRNTYTVAWDEAAGTCSGFPWLRCEHRDAAGAFRSIHGRAEALLASPATMTGSRTLYSPREDMRHELDELFRDVVTASREDSPYKNPGDFHAWQDRTLARIVSMLNDLDTVEDDEVIRSMMDSLRQAARH